MLRPNNIQQVPYIKPLLNTSCRLDIPTGEYLPGKYGESILNGGLTLVTGITAEGNRFKSTIAHGLNLIAMDRMIQGGVDSSYILYDTEINIQPYALLRFTEAYKSFIGRNIINDGQWVITDKTIYWADKFYEFVKEFLTSKMKEKKNTVNTPFVDGHGKFITMPIPTFMSIDSFAHFTSSAIAKMQEENELGESGGLMIFQRSGLDKRRFLDELPAIVGGSGHYTTLVAHYGKESSVKQGPPGRNIPTRQLRHMPAGDEIKGVTKQFNYLVQNFWHIASAGELNNADSKAPLYPTDSEDNKNVNLDLYVAKLVQLRGKNGLTGFDINLVISQKHGLQPELTDLHYVRTIKFDDRKEYFGCSGGYTNFCLDLMPEVKLTRVNARGKLTENYLLRRALEITADLGQLKQFRRHEELWCTPLELYASLKDKYDWNVLLNTRGWWTIDNDKHPIPFLSTMDLLNMRKGLYEPYWLK